MSEEIISVYVHTKKNPCWGWHYLETSSVGFSQKYLIFILCIVFQKRKIQSQQYLYHGRIVWTQRYTPLYQISKENAIGFYYCKMNNYFKLLSGYCRPLSVLTFFLKLQDANKKWLDISSERKFNMLQYKGTLKIKLPKDQFSTLLSLEVVWSFLAVMSLKPTSKSKQI